MNKFLSLRPVLVVLPACGLAAALVPAELLAQVNCANTNGNNCVISVAGGTGGHGQAGGAPSPNPIVRDFNGPQALSAGNNAGAIDFFSRGGNGGDANTHGQNGGSGAGGGTIGSLTVGTGVAAQGANGGGIVRFVSQGGSGGGGDGAIRGTRGRGGQGGPGGPVTVDFEGAISTQDAGSPGLVASTTGGVGGSGNSGGVDFFGAFAGNGGDAGAIALQVGGSVATAGTGVQASAAGGPGGRGPDDTAGANESIASDGGSGGTSRQGVQATVSGTITSSQADGIDAQAQGGRGGDGGDSGPANVSQGGNGGAGGTGGPVSVTISGRVQGASAGVSASGNGGAGGNGGHSSGTLAASGTKGGDGGGAGNGGTASVVVASGGQASGGGVGVAASAAGGNGGNGGTAAGSTVKGGVGMQGGTGGTATVDVAGTVGGTPGAAATGASVTANGGTGGTGAGSGGGSASGGRGGDGGGGGNATATLRGGGSIATSAADVPGATAVVAPGMRVQANGGIGGIGGVADAPLGASGGGAGLGGAGGTATAIADGSVTTSGSFAHGVLAQSAGGMGGGGGDARSLFLAHGGKALNGGQGGTVIVGGSGGMVTTTGTGSAGLLGQSVGGGGGAGGNALSVGVGVAIGGNGGAGGNGGTVKIGHVDGDAASVPLSDTVITRGPEAAAIMAQSIGGAGGHGGNATAVGFAPVSLGIGGDGKSGGGGNSVIVTNDGVVTTFGVQSGGIAAQSVGGGGGSGGAGVGMTGSGPLAIAFALGGTGAGGGTGGNVTVANNQQVTTYGSDAYGVKAQSIGGGGGEGGTATSVAIALSPDPEVPAVSLSVGIGGKGGAGGNQSSSHVVIVNNGFVSTAGDGAFGLLAQNVAGGGGNGGDSTAASYSKGEGNTVAVSIGVAGSGGAGGTGGPVTVANTGLLATLGESAHAVVAQSVAGGGGIGGTGDSAASTSESKYGISGSITVGGQGGTGSQGGLVTITNQGSIATRGDGARAVFAQSVGGGGGASGGGAAKANAANLSMAVTVGGNAGSGGNGGDVDVTSGSAILTQGADADGVFAQSVGGGGGMAGKGSSTNGGAQAPGEAAADLASTIAKGLGLGQNVVQLADGVFKVGDGLLKGVNTLSQLRTLLSGSASVTDEPAEDGTADSLKLSATIGGQGGAGGLGGTVSVANTGQVETQGARSDGLFAQSVGGGGGVGGVTSFSGSSGDTGATLTVGGSGAGAGAGRTVNVGNGAGATIATGGVAANGITAQSVGGGGGKGGLTAASDGGMKNLAVTVGGSGGSGGAGGSVTVTDDGTITTAGGQSVGILAQSVGGGGGTAHALSSDAGEAPASGNGVAVSIAIGGRGGIGGAGGPVGVTLGQNADASIATTGRDGIGVMAQSVGGGGGLIVAPTAAAGVSAGVAKTGLGDGTVIPVTIGATGGASGDGGAVNVVLGAAASSPPSSIGTSGTDAHAVLAQSVGGGGGLVVGAAQAPGALSSLFGSASQRGNGGSVGATLNNGAQIATTGDGAVGVLAQSIGGGGALIGGMSQVDLSTGHHATPVSQSGQGGDVTVNMAGSSSIRTTGTRAHGVFAQSVGGGGGIVGTTDGQGYAFASTSPYTGCSGASCTGTVTVNVTSGSTVLTQGSQAYGVYAQSWGNGVNIANVNVDAKSSVQSQGQSAGAIFIDTPGTGTVRNAGLIDDATVSDHGVRRATGVAIAGSGPVSIVNSGALHGSVALPTGASRLENLPGGTFNAGVTVDLGARGQLHNRGIVEVGGGAISQTRLRGDLVQEADGRIVLDVDSVARRGDTLDVEGSARLGGTLVLRSASLAPQAVTVLRSGTGAAALDVRSLSVVDSGGEQLFGYTPTVSGGAFSVTPYAKLDSAAATAGFGANRQAVASHLQAGFAPGLSAQQGAVYAQVASLPSTAHYASALDSLSGEALQGAGAARLSASLAFTERMNTSWCDAPGSPGSRGDLPQEGDCNWARLIGTDTQRSANRNSMGYDASDTTLQVGAQRRLSEGWFVGGSLSYDRSSLGDNAGLGRVHGDSGSAGLVLKREAGPWLVSGAVDLGFGRYDSERMIAFAQTHAVAKGDFDMWHAGLHSRIAYRMPYAGFYLQPYVDLHAVHVRTGRYSETGAGALGLNVDRSSDTFYSASPMLEIGGRTTLGNGIELRSFVGVGATLHSDTDWGADARLAGWDDSSAPFTATSTVPRRQARLNVGANLTLRQDLDISVEFTGSQAKGFRSRSGALRVNYRF